MHRRQKKSTGVVRILLCSNVWSSLLLLQQQLHHTVVSTAPAGHVHVTNLQLTPGINISSVSAAVPRYVT